MQKKKSRNKLPTDTGVVKAPISKRARHLHKKYGITVEQYDDLLRKQEERCAVCQRHFSAFKCRLSVDHDHKTGEVRGLLCTHCNRYVVGRHRKELGADLLRRAFEYLTADYPGWIVPPKIKKRRRRKKK